MTREEANRRLRDNDIPDGMTRDEFKKATLFVRYSGTKPNLGTTFEEANRYIEMYRKAFPEVFK